MEWIINHDSCDFRSAKLYWFAYWKVIEPLHIYANIVIEVKNYLV